MCGLSGRHALAQRVPLPGVRPRQGLGLATKAFTWECALCGKQTSITAGTLVHGSKLPLTVWFWAAYLMATHSNGIAALQLQKQLGLGSYKSAWLLCGKLRRAMVAPGRAPLSGLVEIDETAIPLRTKANPPEGGHGRSSQGKMLVAGAVEVRDGGPGRVAARRHILLLHRQPARLHRGQCRRRRHRQNRRLASLRRRARRHPRSARHRPDGRPCCPPHKAVQLQQPSIADVAITEKMPETVAVDAIDNR
jgi:hypothetical protein